MRRLLNEATTLDQVFDVLHVPVLLTYESKTVRDHLKSTTDYITKFRSEITAYHQRFVRLNPAKKVKVHLCLIPLKSKKELLDEFDARLQFYHESR